MDPSSESSGNAIVANALPARQVWRWGLPVILVLLFLGILIALPWQAQRLEANERQEQLIADTLWVEQTIRFQLSRNEESLALIGGEIISGRLLPHDFISRTRPMIGNGREVKRVLWLDETGESLAASDESEQARDALSTASQKTSLQVRLSRKAAYSPPVAAANSSGPILLDYHLPLFLDDDYFGELVMSYDATAILEAMVPWWFAQENQIALLDSDDRPIAQRAAAGPGRGIYTHQRALDLPGQSLMLRTNSVKAAPRLIPNLMVGSVIALSLGLAWSLWALWRDINRRLATEGALREQVRFRTAMENSLVTGLRARDLDGSLTYVNPAFCAMVGMRPEELLGKRPPMAYWVPEAMEDYQKRFAEVMAGTITPQGYETVFRRPDGKPFPVLVFESPLLDEAGNHTGWMGSILDISELKEAADLNRRQQEKLNVSARLASMGEIASTLAHELNQPLAAISSYTTGALNLLNDPAVDAADRMMMLKPALQKAAAQAQRAGQIIRSVHAFVKQREPAREAVTIASLFEGVEPLIKLQAQTFATRRHISVEKDMPPILGDRILLEQVLLNLSRNAIESMHEMPPNKRVLRITASRTVTAAGQQAILIAIIDQGHGISASVSEHLYSPLFSTKSEGMGMGLNICRTVIEFHGGTLIHSDNPTGGTIFQFTLPVAVEDYSRVAKVDALLSTASS